VNWLKFVLVAFGGSVLLAVIGVIAIKSLMLGVQTPILPRTSLAISNQSIRVKGYVDRVPSRLSARTPEAQPKPDLSNDQGAIWTPDDVGRTYDLSDTDQDEIFP